jgi:hypothetical protein
MNAWRYLILVPLLAGCAAGGQQSSALDQGIVVTSPPKETSGATPIFQSTPAAPGGKEQPMVKVELPNLGPAPELTNDVWLNTPRPLRLEDLRGKVVLLDMWTFG